MTATYHFQRRWDRVHLSQTELIDNIMNALYPKLESNPEVIGTIKSKLSGKIKHKRQFRSGNGKDRDGKVKDGKSKVGKAEDGKAEDGRAGDGRAGDGRAGDGRSGDGRAGDGKAEDDKAEDGRAEDGRAEDGRAEDGRAEEYYYTSEEDVFDESDPVEANLFEGDFAEATCAHVCNESEEDSKSYTSGSEEIDEDDEDDEDGEDGEDGEDDHSYLDATGGLEVASPIDVHWFRVANIITWPFISDRKLTNKESAILIKKPLANCGGKERKKLLGSILELTTAVRDKFRHLSENQATQYAFFGKENFERCGKVPEFEEYLRTQLQEVDVRSFLV